MTRRYAIGPVDDIGHPDFVGVAEGFDLTRPPTADEVAAIVAGMDRYGILVFPGQRISDEQQLAFARSFGQLELVASFLAAEVKEVKGETAGFGRRLANQVNDFSNLGADGRPVDPNDPRKLRPLTNRLWHSDSAYRSTPAKYSFLSARAIPSVGGETQFADMRAAYDALPRDMRAMIDDLMCEHDVQVVYDTIGFTEEQFRDFGGLTRYPPVVHPLVRRHNSTGRRSIFMSASSATIEGMSLVEGRLLLRELLEHATQREFVYSHHWQLNDLVIWDNRVVMHRSRPYDETQVRQMHRTTISEGEPVLETL